MTRWLAIVFLSPWIALAQPQMMFAPFMAPAAGTAVLPLNDVTNLSGYPISSFYLPSSAGYVTNTNVRLLDYSTNQWHMTNSEAGGKWPVRQVSVSGINSKDSILFDGADDYLNSVLFTNGARMEIVMVFRYNDVTNSSAQYMLNGKGAASYTIRQHTDAKFYTSATSFMTIGETITNKWYVLDVVCNGGSGLQTYTNNVSANSTVAAQSKTQNGMTFGADNFLGNCGPLDLALLVTYGNADQTFALPGTNTTARTAVYSALTNYFNLAP